MAASGARRVHVPYTYYQSIETGLEPREEAAADLRASRFPRRAKIVFAALGLVAMATLMSAAVVVHSASGLIVMPGDLAEVRQVRSRETLDASYDALAAPPVNCNRASPDFEADLPTWDAEFSDSKAFYNSCYYSFRCCTTTGNSNGCYVSDNYGDACRSCLKSNSPKFVKKDCVKWLNEPGKDAGGEVDNSEWTKEDLLADHGVPHTGNPLYAVMFKNYPGAPTEKNGETDTRSCWQKRGSSDKKVTDYADKCFTVISWCNTLCPRDTAYTVDHVMCKHCVLFGFQLGYWDIAKWQKANGGIGKIPRQRTPPPRALA